MLEADFPPEYAGFERRSVGRALVYNGTVDVPDVGARRLALIFAERPGLRAPIVMADGPRRSRHRYRWARPTSLCIWHPDDPPPGRWSLREGLAGLIDRARVHLFLEAWWRVSGRWDAPEVHREPWGDERARAGRVRRKVARQRCWCGTRRYSACHGAISEARELAAVGLDG